MLHESEMIDRVEGRAHIGFFRFMRHHDDGHNARGLALLLVDAAIEMWWWPSTPAMRARTPGESFTVNRM